MSDALQALMEQPSTPALPLTPSWSTTAACDGRYDLLDAAMLPAGPERQAGKAALLKLCAQCPVRALCKARGVSVAGYGIWGGVELTHGRVRRMNAAGSSTTTTETAAAAA